MHFGIVTGPNSGDENFRIVTGSKLAAKRSLINGGYLTRIVRYQLETRNVIDFPYTLDPATNKRCELCRGEGKPRALAE